MNGQRFHIVRAHAVRAQIDSAVGLNACAAASMKDMRVCLSAKIARVAPSFSDASLMGKEIKAAVVDYVTASN